MVKNSIGGFMAQLRKNAGYTQQEVAEKLNVSNRTLSSWETDRTVPDVTFLPAIAGLYGVTVDGLLRGEEVQREQIALKESEAQNGPLKEQYNIFNRKLNTLTLFGILCSLVVFTGFTILLYSAAPLWLDAALIVAGFIVNAVLIILMFKHERVALRNTGDNENAYALALRHKISFSLIYNALAYFMGAVVQALCYCFAPIGEVSGRVYEFYDTYAAVVISISAIPAAVLLLAGVLNDVLYTDCLGNAEQKSNLGYNKKLLKKISLYGIIPVAASLVPYIILSYVPETETEKTYFTANGVDEVYKNFQTLTFDFDTNYTDYETTIPQGEYYLNFQSENYIECGEIIGSSHYIDKFYDLGNNFYAYFRGKDAGGTFFANVYYLKDGVSVDDISVDVDYDNYFMFYENATEVCFESPDGEEMLAYSFIYNYSSSVYYSTYYNSSSKLVMSRKGDVYAYRLIYYYDYSPLAFYVFTAATAVTVLTCAAIHLVKRKKQYYTF